MLKCEYIFLQGHKNLTFQQKKKYFKKIDCNCLVSWGN